MGNQPGNMPSFVNYLRSFGGRWFTAMSGPLSVPFAVSAVLVTNNSTKIALWITAMGCVLFASYWTWRVEREKVIGLEEKIARLLDEYSHALRLESIATEEVRQLDQSDAVVHRRIRFLLGWRNTISRPVLYITRKTEVDGVALPIGNSDEVISRSSSTTFYRAFIDRPTPQGNVPEHYAISIEVHYGPANLPPRRLITKKLNLTLWPGMGRTDFIYDVNKDEPLKTN